jgi:hypothetical protein
MADQTQQVADELQSRMAQVEARLKEFSDATQLADDCLSLLAQARAEIAAGHLPDAHTLVVRAECLLWRADKSAQTLRAWGPVIGIYQVALLLGLLLLAPILVGGVQVAVGRPEGGYVIGPVATVAQALGRRVTWDGANRRLLVE